MPHVARGKCGTQKKPKKIHRLGTIAQLCWAVSSQIRHVSTIQKNLLNRNVSPTRPHDMVNFGLLTAEIISLVWETPANFDRVSLLGSITERHCSSGHQPNFVALNRGHHYIRQGGHRVGHWPTF